MKVKRSTIQIISGGQTGVDQLALKIAKELGIPTGGYINKGFKTEYGNMPELESLYNLIQIPSTSYTDRTRLNVTCSHCTLIYGDTTSPGARATINHCRTHNKPYSLNPTRAQVRVALERGYRIFNIAGNRMSKLDQQTYFDIDWAIREAFENETE